MSAQRNNANRNSLIKEISKLIKGNYYSSDILNSYENGDQVQELISHPDSLTGQLIIYTHDNNELYALIHAVMVGCLKLILGYY